VATDRPQFHRRRLAHHRVRASRIKRDAILINKSRQAVSEHRAKPYRRCSLLRSLQKSNPIDFIFNLVLKSLLETGGKNRDIGLRQPVAVNQERPKQAQEGLFTFISSA
jgi:hypothetical protein